MKKDLKQRAIFLRKEGMTYSEILKEVSVAKSTLSLWLRSVALSQKQQHAYTQKKRSAGLRGGMARKRERISRMESIIVAARNEPGPISDRELWLMGIMLYWAEGTKEKPWRTGAKVQLSNSDPKMIKLYVLWLVSCLRIPQEDIDFDLYIHESYSKDTATHLRYWVSVLGEHYSTIHRVYFKRNVSRTKRRNIGDSYHGQLRVTVKRSIDLNRRISGWIDGICERCPVV